MLRWAVSTLFKFWAVVENCVGGIEQNTGDAYLQSGTDGTFPWNFIRKHCLVEIWFWFGFIFILHFIISLQIIFLLRNEKVFFSVFDSLLFLNQKEQAMECFRLFFHLPFHSFIHEHLNCVLRMQEANQETCKFKS